MTPGGTEAKLKRKSRAMDPDLRWLKAADKAFRLTSPRMRRALLEYLYDKFLIRQPAWLREFDRKRQESAA